MYKEFKIIVTNIPQFIFWTIIRGIYFWISPTIFDWNSIKDILGVLLDVIPLVYIVFLICKRKPYEYVNKQYVAGIIILILYTLVYAWGVRNAGGAIRHRNMLMKLNGKIQNIKDFTMYPQSYFSPNSIKMIFGKKPSKSYTIHHFFGSWLDKEKRHGIKVNIGHYIGGKVRNLIGTDRYRKLRRI